MGCKACEILKAEIADDSRLMIEAADELKKMNDVCEEQRAVVRESGETLAKASALIAELTEKLDRDRAWITIKSLMSDVDRLQRQLYAAECERDTKAAQAKMYWDELEMVRGERDAMKSQAGFSLVELMVVVALIGILVSIALPFFAGTVRRSKADSEVMPMFNDFRIRLDQYHQERGVYPGGSESNAWPLPASSTLKPLQPFPEHWQAIKFRNSGPGDTRCSYAFVTSPGPVGPIGAMFKFVPPASDWYYIVAHCDQDNDSAVDGYFFTSSSDPLIKKLNASH